MHKQNRLAKRQDFNKVYRYGKSAANQQFIVYFINRSAEGPVRIGISVSKKVGNAVVRNRIRRLVKEIMRHRLDELGPKQDLILIARKPAADMEYKEMEKSLLHVLKRASLVRRIKG